MAIDLIAKKSGIGFLQNPKRNLETLLKLQISMIEIDITSTEDHLLQFYMYLY